MDGLLTLLLFAGVFYVMMRYGCGAHMVHGHGGHSSHGSHASQGNSVGHAMRAEVPIASATDPVCGMDVDPKTNYGRRVAGKEFRFCSRKCLDRFDDNPSAYVGGKGAST